MGVAPRAKISALASPLAGTAAQEGDTMRTRDTTARRVALAGMTALGGALLLGGAGPASATTLITRCGYKITAPGTYVLAKNLTCIGDADGIDIYASDVRLVLGGRTITSTGLSSGLNGVSAHGATAPLTGLSITGGTVTGFSIGVDLTNVAGGVVDGVKVPGDGGRGSDGIVIQNSTNVRVVGNTVTGVNSYGISMLNATSNYVAGNKVSGSWIYDLSDDNLPACVNVWGDNRFATDNEAGADAGPGAACIR
jgi:parallel beta-helix repeat protein